MKIVGHAEVKRALAASRGHALTLAGPARVGRRPLARWHATRLNCNTPNEEPDGLEPCGHCPSCRMFEAGSHPDYLEIGPRHETRAGKAARVSLIPIRAISERHDHPDREYEQHVVEWLETGPRTRHKVVVFDGAEFLNEPAANALLKVVEEPPHGAHFVFVTEDVSGMLPTITSRSSTVRVPPVSPREMAAALLELSGEPDPELLEFAAGRPGLLFERDRAREALRNAEGFLEALGGGLLASLTAADGLEKAWSRDLTPEALAFTLRRHPPGARLAADDGLTAALEALEHYASPSLAFAVLALRWRTALGLVG